MRLLMLSVTGGGVAPYDKLVSVEDPTEFLGTLRARLLKERIDKLNEIPLTDDLQANALRMLKVKLYETGRDTYPDTEQEVDALYKKFAQRLHDE